MRVCFLQCICSFRVCLLLCVCVCRSGAKREEEEDCEKHLLRFFRVSDHLCVRVRLFACT